MEDLMKKEKHDHKLTNILKFVIFAIVMLAPFFAILSKMVYVSVNKNAKDSYYGQTINEQKLIQTNDLKINKEYVVNNSTRPIPTDNIQSTNLTVRNVKNLNPQDNRDYTNVNNITFFMYPTTNATNVVMYMKNGSTNLHDINVNTTYVYFSFELEGYTNLTMINQMNITFEISYNKYSYLDNVFYYAIDQSKESELLKWTKNTPIYNVINSMNNGFGLSTNHILTYLLTYWSTMIAIYIIFDIVIFALTKLTHGLQ